jgi:hypothetical protein
MEYITVYTNANFSLKVNHVGWLYRRGKGTVLLTCTASKISCLSIICCPNLQVISKIFKHITRMVGLYQRTLIFLQAGRMIIIGVYNTPSE